MNIFYIANPKVKSKIQRLELESNQIVWGSFSNNIRLIKDYIHQGGNQFVAIGGDGTVFDLMNGLYHYCKENNRDLSKFVIGAIAAGSSNDFHKNEPTLPEFGNRRCCFAEAQHSDLLLFECSNGSFVTNLNASIGITAEANTYFNKNGFFLRVLKSVSMNLAIVYAAIRSLMRFNGLYVDLSEGSVKIANLSFIKSRFFAGSFYYPELVSSQDGMFAVYQILQSSKLALIQNLFQLSNGIFQNSAGCKSFRTNYLEFSSPEGINLEINGEVIFTHTCKVSILKGAIQLCPLK